MTPKPSNPLARWSATLKTLAVVIASSLIAMAFLSGLGESLASGV